MRPQTPPSPRQQVKGLNRGEGRLLDTEARYTPAAKHLTELRHLAKNKKILGI